MNIIKDDINQGKRDFSTQKPITVKPTLIGNTLMPPPSNKFVTPSCRIRNKDHCPSSTSHSKSTPTIKRDSHIIVSICEGRGKARGIVGIAAIDIHRPVLIFSEISDTQTYTSTLTKLNILRPSEVIVPSSFITNATPVRLVTVISNQFPNLSVNSVPRSEYNKSRGLQMIQTICLPTCSDVIPQITEKFYVLSASCALLRYVEQCRKVLYCQKSVKVEFHEPEDTTAIDIDTAELLELTTYTGTQKHSLFTVLNYCSTQVGRKLLRTNILQPPRKKKIIETRLDCVQELVENPNLLTRLQENLKLLGDIHASVTFATVVPATAETVSERQLNYTLQLKGLLIAVEPLANELKGTKHPVYRDIYNRIEGLDTRQVILDKINNIINADAHLSKGHAGELQRCFAIKNGLNELLDLSRRLYTEGVDDMRSYVSDLSTEYNLPLRVQHTMKNGFHIMLPLNKALRNLRKTDLPPIFINTERFRSHFYLTTMKMINFDRRSKNNSIEIQNISNIMIYELLVSLRPHIAELFTLCDDIAQLDMFVSLARASSQANWIRPKLVDTHMYLEGARHPILEKTSDQEVVSNTIYAYPRCNVHILTSPNMSGKTIYLHTICLLQVLCQIGCFVPCTSAVFRISQRISARVAEDDSNLTQSNFSLEMSKLSYLLSTLTDTSLIVLDELCKTTASDEGVSLAQAVIEKLAARGCFVFTASHFLTLTVMEDMYPNIKNWHFETLEENRANNTRIGLKFTYKLIPCATNMDFYGIKLSRIFNSSPSIFDRALVLYNYLLRLRKSTEAAKESHPKSSEYLKFRFQAELDLMKIKNQLTEEIQKDKINEFKVKTGLNFEPSPITIERTNSNSFSNPSSTKSSSEAVKKVSDSSSPIRCLSTKTDSSTNHEFSVPTSLKSDKNIEKSDSNDHIFSIDGIEIQENSSFLESYIRNSQSNLRNLDNICSEKTNSRFVRPINTASNTSDDDKFSFCGSNIKGNSPFLNSCSRNSKSKNFDNHLYYKGNNSGYVPPIDTDSKTSVDNNFSFSGSGLQGSSSFLNSDSIKSNSENFNKLLYFEQNNSGFVPPIDTESKTSDDSNFSFSGSSSFENFCTRNSKSRNFSNVLYSKENNSGFVQPINTSKTFENNKFSSESTSSSFLDSDSRKPHSEHFYNNVLYSERNNSELVRSIEDNFSLNGSELQENYSFFNLGGNNSKSESCNSKNMKFSEETNSEFVPRSNFENKATMFLPDNDETNKFENKNEKSGHWSAADNTINNAHASSVNMIVNSTNSEITEKHSDNKSPCERSSESFSNISKLPFTASQQDISSPILNKRNRKNPPKIDEKPKEIRLVSELYESESSDEDCVIIDNMSINEESFEKDLNFKRGATSTPKIIDHRNNESILSRSIDSLKYLSNIFETPILKRKLSPTISSNEKIAKVVSESDSHYDSCESSFISKCSTNVIIGQNDKIQLFPKPENNIVKNDTSTSNSKYLSANLDSSSLDFD